MAVNPDEIEKIESEFFRFKIIRKPSKNNFTEKPSKDKEHKDNMSTSSSPPPTPNNEKLDEKDQNSQEINKPPEVKVDDIPNNNIEDSTIKEQKNEEKSSQLTIQVPSRSTSPQLVASPSDIRAKTPEPTISPISPPQNSNIFKKLGNMIKGSPENGTTPDQEEVATSNSKDQVQEEQQVENNAVADDNIANDKITENTVDIERSIAENKKVDEDKKNTPEPTAAKKRTGSLSNLVNMKMFITRTSSLLVGKLKEEFDNLDRRIYPDMDPDWDAENQSREAAISEREQLLENKDVEITNGSSQNPQSTQNIMAEVGVALNERQEKLDNIGQKTEELSNSSNAFLELATQIKENQAQKNKSWFGW
ncbi:hypothetical protein GLOIN_2v1618434 [Rhizophagus clarus]|uniref:V-SNARE coiled-coil homology domain-containing protein n=1 Tax=Rhizophagus clarus TaxID=94130 RepID=A0A8H3QPN1_9GLOM|nr:hypothetical protein GLOIN_2v1618434 [Rhizophagus clarus]